MPKPGITYKGKPIGASGKGGSKKKSSGLCHKAAATAACRKLLVCIWGMLRSGTFFNK